MKLSHIKRGAYHLKPSPYTMAPPIKGPRIETIPAIVYHITSVHIYNPNGPTNSSLNLIGVNLKDRSIFTTTQSIQCVNSSRRAHQ
jgi:hypothetical protein